MASQTWGEYLAEQWGVDVDITQEQRDELNQLSKSIGKDELRECVGIVAAANQPSRNVRYLLGVINNRRKEQRITVAPMASPMKPATRPAYIYKRCTRCLFVNQIRRDSLEQNRGRMMRCGGVECKNQWPVDDIIRETIKETDNATTI